MHGIYFNPTTKIPRLIQFAQKMDAEVLVFNYRGYAYSQDAKCNEESL